MIPDRLASDGFYDGQWVALPDGGEGWVVVAPGRSPIPTTGGDRLVYEVEIRTPAGLVAQRYGVAELLEVQ